MKYINTASLIGGIVGGAQLSLLCLFVAFMALWAIGYIDSDPIRGSFTVNVPAIELAR